MNLKRLFHKRHTKVLTVVSLVFFVVFAISYILYLIKGHDSAANATVFFAVAALFSCVFLFSETYITRKSYKIIDERIEHFKKHNMPCQMINYKETDFLDVLFLNISKRWFLISHNNQKYVINDNGCFRITEDEYKKHYIYDLPDNNDSFENSLLTKYYAERKTPMDKQNESPVIYNKDGYILLKTNGVYTINDYYMSFEITEKEALDITEGKIKAEKVFQRFLVLNIQEEDNDEIQN